MQYLYPSSSPNYPLVALMHLHSLTFHSFCSSRHFSLVILSFHSSTVITPYHRPPRATSFTGLLNMDNNNNEVDYTAASGPPTPYDNEGSPPDEAPPNFVSHQFPTFSFLNIPTPETQNRRNITLSKLWDMNPLVSLPPPSCAVCSFFLFIFPLPFSPDYLLIFAKRRAQYN